MNEKNEEKTVWLIRFADGTIASSYGTKEGAKLLAEHRKDLYGGSYIII